MSASDQSSCGDQGSREVPAVDPDQEALGGPTRQWRTPPPRPSPDNSSTVRRLAIVIVVAIAAGIGIGAAVGIGTGRHASPRAVAPGDGAVSSSTGPAAIGPASSVSPGPASPIDSHASPPRTSDGCDGLLLAGRCGQVQIEAGVVTVGTHQFAIGSPLDHVVVGDWDCDGEPTVAVVRPGTGEVFAFDRWSLDGPIEAQLVAALDAVGPPRTVELDNGCEALHVPHGAGTWTLSDSAS